VRAAGAMTPAVRPVVCMITDRGRFGADAEHALVERVARAARAGVHLIQVRERDMDGGPLTQLVQRCVEAVRRHLTRIIVNDRLDVALAAGAHGVHLRADSMAASRVRMMVPRGFLVGQSIHTPEEASRAAAEGAADYLIFGAVFPTSSKPEAPAAGVDALARAAAATTIPILAVGGVTSTTVRGLARSGAAGFAAIGLFALDADDGLHVTSQASMAFDTPAGVP
jgi:thiamine-phosphate diphosphorylase